MKNRISALMCGSAMPVGPVFAADDGDGAGDPPAAAPEQVLFGGEGDKPADPPAGNKDGGEGDKAGGDWKEYVADPAKSDEENAAAKAEHDKTKPADKKDENKDDPANKVPEDGKYDLKMPDGVELDEELAGALGPDFKELGLTNAQAQKLVDRYIAVNQDRTKKQAEDWGNTIQKWHDDAKADKEIGGTNWDATVSSAQRAMNALGTPELKEYLQASGGGNHPELIRVFAKVGKFIKEDDPAKGGAEGAGKPADPAHVLFPNDAPKGT